MDIFKLQNEVWKIAEEKGWHDKEISFGDFISLCHAELSEALEIFRDGSMIGVIEINKEAAEHFSCGKNDMEVVIDEIPTGIPIELADCIMRILDYCETKGIPMYQAIETKMIYNKTRPYRHGNKVI